MGASLLGERITDFEDVLCATDIDRVMLKLICTRIEFKNLSLHNLTYLVSIMEGPGFGKKFKK
jgi:hypothetical protein